MAPAAPQSGQKSAAKLTAQHVPTSLPPFKNLVVMTDFGDDVANAQIEMRFRNVWEWVHEETVKRNLMPAEIVLPKRTTAEMTTAPAVMHVADIPFSNVDYAAYALYCCYRALGRSRPNLFLHVCDPGVGTEEDRSILVTDYGNTFIGPDNTTLGLMRAYFAERGIQSRLWRIDRDKVEELEQYRMEEPTYHIPRIFHGRDIFAVAAGLLAGGISPAAIAKDEIKQGPRMSVFAESITNLPMKLHTPVSCAAFRDNTYGNLKTNLTVDALTFDQLVEEQAQFKVTVQATDRKWWQCSRKSMVFTAQKIFADVPKKSPVMYLGSTFAPEWDARFVELALNLSNVSQALGLPRSYHGASELTIERLR